MASNKTDFGGQNFPLHDVRNSRVTQRKGNKMPGLQAVKGKPVDSEGIEMEEGDTKLLPPVRQSSEAASDAGAVGEHAKDEDMNRKVNIQENLGQRNPAVFSDAGDDADKDLKQEQRGAIGARLIGGDASDGRSSWADGQAGAEKSSPVRTDSKHGALTKTDSTVPSGRSVLSITNHQGGDGAAIAPPSSSKGATYCCCWERCHACFSTSPDLAEHIRSVHVDSQHGEVFACLWRGCKVYNTPSSSPGWLQRHMLSHSGNKPFKCVVAGCSASFASQLGVARHVPSHFSQQSSSKGSGQSRSKEEPSSKAVGRRSRLRNRLQRSLPKPRDFFDARTMDAIRHKAICLNLATHIESLGSGHSVVFYSTVIARRKEDSGKVKVLLHWTPEDILPDAWVNETDRQQLKTKVVHLSQLAHDTALLLDPNVYRIFF